MSHTPTLIVMCDMTVSVMGLSGLELELEKAFKGSLLVLMPPPLPMAGVDGDLREPPDSVLERRGGRHAQRIWRRGVWSVLCLSIKTEPVLSVNCMKPILPREKVEVETGTPSRPFCASSSLRPA